MTVLSINKKRLKEFRIEINIFKMEKTKKICNFDSE